MNYLEICYTYTVIAMYYAAYVHVMAITCAQEICLMCMPEAHGPHVQGLRRDLSDKS